MADLGTLRPGANDATATPNQSAGWDDIPGATELADDSDSTFGGDSTNSDGTYGESFALGDTPSDLTSMDTLLFSVRHAWASAVSNSNYDIQARIVNGSTILAALNSGGAMQQFVVANTSNTITTTTATAWSYVNTTADKTAWDGAIIQIEFIRERAKGGDAVAMQVYEVFVTGTYTAQTLETHSEAGAITPTGTLANAKLASLSVGGAVTPAGTLAQLARQLLAGGLTGGGGGHAVEATTDFTLDTSADPWDFSVTKPSGTAQGDLLVFAVGFASGSETIDSVPSGFTEFSGSPIADSGPDTQLHAYWKVAGASEPSSYTWSTANAATGAGTMFRISGAPDTSPIDGSQANSQDTAVTNWTTASITPNEDNCFLLALACSDGNAGHANPQWAPEGGWNEEADHRDEVQYVQFAAQSKQQTTATAESADFTRTDADQGAMLIIAIKPAAGGGGVAGDVANIYLAATSQAGAVTPAGTHVAQAQQQLAGAITPTGTEVQVKEGVEEVAIAGGITPTGVEAQVLEAATSQAGAVTPTGDLTHEAQTAHAGSITPTGDLTHEAQATHAGSIAPTGDEVQRQERATAQAGAITPTGALSHEAQALLAGAMAPQGTLAHEAAQQLAGAITPTGDLKHEAATSYAGAITPTGTDTHTKVAVRSDAGSIAPAGALVDEAQRAEVGSIAPAGALGPFAAQQVHAGSIAPTGVLANVKVAVLAVAGVIAPTGAIANEVRALLAGAVAPAGAVSAFVSHALAATLSTAGTLVQEARNVLAGAITPTGTETQQETGGLELLNVAGAITPTGDVANEAAMSEAGAIAPAGSPSHEAQHEHAGSITPTGTETQVKVAVHTETGAIAPTGDLEQLVSRSDSGALPLSGTIRHETQVTHAGSVTPAGALTAAARIVVQLAGSITPTGDVATRLNIVLAGAIAPAGAIVQTAFTRLAGAIAPAGTVVPLLIGLGLTISGRGARIATARAATASIRSIRRAARIATARRDSSDGGTT